MCICKTLFRQGLFGKTALAPMLKEAIDEDDFCKRLRMAKEDGSVEGFYGLFHSLLDDPSLQVLESLLSTYGVADVINGLKHLIKFKFDRLTRNVEVNVLSIVRMMLEYEENIDTLIINLLRHHLVDEVYSMYKDRPRYFATHPTSLMFLTFFCAQNRQTRGSFGDSSLPTRDFLFMEVKEVLETPLSREGGKKRVKRDGGGGDKYPSFPFASHFSSRRLLPALFTPTPLNLLSSQLSVDLEMNIMFILENEENFDFHMHLLLKDYVKCEDDACRVLRFVANVPCPLNIVKVVDSLLDRYPLSYIALVYDLLFWTQGERPNGNLMEYLRGDGNKVASRLSSLSEEWESLRLVMASLKKRQEHTVESIARTMHGLNFHKYFGMIKEMEKWGAPIVPEDMYDRVIAESSEWDGYAQVYLWKILGFQKIYLGLEVSVSRAMETLEAIEGLEIVRGLSAARKPR